MKNLEKQQTISDRLEYKLGLNYELSDLQNEDNYNKIDEDLLFKDIRLLEEFGYKNKAAFMLITYINITMNQDNKIAMSTRDKLVDLVKYRVHTQNAVDDTILLSAKKKDGVQNWQNYCLLFMKN
jgi:hypothetical protein